MATTYNLSCMYKTIHMHVMKKTYIHIHAYTTINKDSCAGHIIPLKARNLIVYILYIPLAFLVWDTRAKKSCLLKIEPNLFVSLLKVLNF